MLTAISDHVTNGVRKDGLWSRNGNIGLADPVPLVTSSLSDLGQQGGIAAGCRGVYAKVAFVQDFERTRLSCN